MGRNGEHFAIAAYLGSEGLKGYCNLQDHDVPYTYLDAYLSQKCLMASFEDEEVLDTEDEKVLKEVGYEAAGPHACPKFRSHTYPAVSLRALVFTRSTSNVSGSITTP